MLKLFHSPASPYVRKVMVMAIERGVEDRIELLGSAASPVNRDQAIVQHNPTGKVPTALLPDGLPLFDSRVICQYVDTMGPAASLYPRDAGRFAVLTLEALADGLLDAALLLRYESVMRPEPKRWAEWMAGQSDKIDSSLNAMEGAYFDTLTSGFHAGAVASACALGYLDFRFADRDWRRTHPKLAGWYASVAVRPSMVKTAPPAS